MEHSALHALLLTGLIVALGGPVAVLFLFRPSARVFGLESNVPLVDAMLQSSTRWVCYGALAATAATFIDFFVQVAELQGQTVFAGADIATVIRFATQTVVGNLCLARAALLLLTVGAVWLPGKLKWWLVGALAWSAVIVSSLVSHAAAQPEHRLPGIIAQITHITGAALWMGVLLHLFVARGLLFANITRERVAFIAEVVRRFSPLALTMTSLIGLSGLFAAYRYMQTFGALFTSPYGLTLCVKLVLILPAICAGYVNFRCIRPKLLAIVAENNSGDDASAKVLQWFSKMLELEITAGVLVITVAGILGSVSPPGDDGSTRLTAAQTHVFLQPHLPNVDVHDWQNQDDPSGVTDAGMRYSEFTHNWSGVMVCMMGLAWLAQSAGGVAGIWAGRIFPFLLVPFGIFIALAADPELWILHMYSPMDAITNPQLLEHQLGAAMIFIIAWLAWRDQKNPPEKKPLGYPLPIIMIAGSLLLLGHAHSTTVIPDNLINLINVQHAVFGAFGLFAGVTRLFMLRGLVPARAARFAWPSFVLGLGLFMAFFYREMV